MTEDPLERIERQEREKQNRKGGLKTATIALGVLAIALAGGLAWIWSQKRSLVGELETEKAELAQQMLSLQTDFENLNSDYENINLQLDTSREQVAALIDQLAKTEATNRAKIRQYEKELGTLRSILRGYIVQIDSLNTLNKKLTADAAAARQEARRMKTSRARLKTSPARWPQGPSSSHGACKWSHTMAPKGPPTVRAASNTWLSPSPSWKMPSLKRGRSRYTSG